MTRDLAEAATVIIAAARAEAAEKAAPQRQEEKTTEVAATLEWSDDRKSNNPHKEARRFQVFRDYSTSISKLANNDNLSVRDRVTKLNDMSRKFMTGYPFKNGNYAQIGVDGVPVLARLASAQADQLLSVEKIKAGGGRKSDFGRVEV